jgi:8-amino-7-oxononanoate synthase
MPDGFAARLAALSGAGRLRTLEALHGAQGPEIDLGGEALVNFCSNDYLGLANHPRVRDAMKAGIERYGAGSGASALLSGRSIAHVELEAALAAAVGRERALLFSSGYLANLGVLAALVGRHDRVFHDRLNHASLIDGVKLSGAVHHRYPHADAPALAAVLGTAPATAVKWVVTDGVFSMDGDVAPLAALAAVCKDAGATLVCDDAHGFGVLGAGRGTVAHCGLGAADVPLIVVTFGKALGTAGAAIAGPAEIIEYLVQSARTFIYDTAPPPALAAATHEALTLALEDASLRKRLASNVEHFRAGLRARGLPDSTSTTPIQPVMLGSDHRALAAASSLRARGLYVRAVRPPTVPEGTARLRICLSAAHDTAQIDFLLDGLAALPEAA